MGDFDEIFGGGFDAEEVPGARGDPMHLWAADGYSNNIHNNLAYGFVDKSKDFLDTGDKEGFSYAKGNYKGTSLSLGSGTVFEPQDSDKGDIARACFYMVARYNNIAGDDDTIDAGNPNLTIANVNWSNSDTGTSTASQATEMGILKDLLAWHKMDPVDEYERTRNDLLYRNYTSNRNPFIDYPNWVEAIWGSVTLGSDLHSVASYDPTPNGKADPKNDKIYGDEAAPIPVSSNDPSTSSASSSEPSTPSDPSPSDNKTNLLGLPLPVLIGIAAASVVILILVIVIFSKASKKQRKAAKKAIAKAVKGSSKKSSSSKKKR